MIKNITRTIEKSTYMVYYVDMDTMEVKNAAIPIYETLEEKNIENALKEELKAICNNATYLKRVLLTRKKYKCSMPIDFYIDNSEHTEIDS